MHIMNVYSTIMITAKLKNIKLIFPVGPTFNNNSIFFNYILTIF